MATLKSLLMLGVSVYLLALLLLFVFQRQLLYFPSPRINHSYQTLRVDVNGATLEIISLNPAQARAILYFGGNAEAVVQNAESFRMLFPQHSIYLINYRGYGGSTGKPSEKALYADALAIYDHIASDHEKISVIGRSLGSGVATWLATNREIDKLALITPFDNIANVAQGHYPIFPVKWLLNDKYDSLSRASKIQAPTLLLIAEFDQIVPPRHALALKQGISTELVSSVTIDTADHNDISTFANFEQQISSFFN